MAKTQRKPKQAPAKPVPTTNRQELDEFMLRMAQRLFGPNVTFKR